LALKLNTGIKKGGSGRSRRLSSAVVELAGGPLGRVIVTARRFVGAGYDFSPGDLGVLSLRRLSPPSRKTSEVSTRRSAIAVAMVVLKWC
jgi:hypothetical protein